MNSIQVFVLKWGTGHHSHYTKNELNLIGIVVFGILALAVLFFLYVTVIDVWKKTEGQRRYISNLFWYTIIFFLLSNVIVGFFIEDVFDKPISWIGTSIFSLFVSWKLVSNETKRNNKK